MGEGGRFSAMFEYGVEFIRVHRELFRLLGQDLLWYADLSMDIALFIYDEYIDGVPFYDHGRNRWLKLEP